jgi:hypothetical protein
MSKAGYAVVASVTLTIAAAVIPIAPEWLPFVRWAAILGLFWSCAGWLLIHFKPMPRDFHSWREKRGKMATALVGLLGAGLSIAVWLYVHPPADHSQKTPEKTKPPSSGQNTSQTGKGNTSTQQQSTGANSPNISGNNNVVTYGEAKKTGGSSTFTENVSNVSYAVIFGGITFGIGKDNTRLRPVNLIDAKDSGFVRAYVEKGKLYVDATLGTEKNKVVDITHNHFKSPPLGWDRNFNETALEFVDENLNPHLQFVYLNARTIEITGLFYINSNYKIYARKGQTIINPTAAMQPLPRLFKYPSRKYLGQEVD